MSFMARNVVEAESAKDFLKRRDYGPVRKFRFCTDGAEAASVCFTILARSPVKAVKEANEWWSGLESVSLGGFLPGHNAALHINTGFSFTEEHIEDVE